MDGTLVDSIPAWHKTFNQALENQGLETVSYEFFCESVLGESTQEDISRFFPKLSVEELVNLYDDFFPENIGLVRLFPNTLEVLDFLDEKKLKKVIVTNTPRELMLLTLDSLDITHRFDHVIGGSDVSVGKPHPEMLEKACSLTNLSKDEVLMVGDTSADTRAGVNAKIRTIGIGVGGDWEIKDLCEFIPLLKDII